MDFYNTDLSDAVTVAGDEQIVTSAVREILLSLCEAKHPSEAAFLQMGDLADVKEKAVCFVAVTAYCDFKNDAKCLTSSESFLRKCVIVGWICQL